VPFANEPMTGMKIESWNNQGFKLSHADIPTKDKSIWLDFAQLPLNQLNIEMGIIKNPLTFVESILGGTGTTSMVLLRADTFDYLELLEDKKIKDESPKFNPSQLKPGDQVISCICREANPMIYLGKFTEVSINSKSYYYGYNSRDGVRNCYIKANPERYYFAYPQLDGTYVIEGYPLTNKKVVEVFMAKDRGKAFSEDRFNDYDKNHEILLSYYFSPNKRKDSGFTCKVENLIKNFDFIKYKEYGYGWQTIYISKNKKSSIDEGVEYFNNLKTGYGKVYKNKKEYDDWYSASKSRW
jgi:hypothetical protein